jgi:prepilin-type N-terminal cleavage/methylation domain-containing protein
MQRQAGVSLVELMVALALGSIIILGAVQLYLSALTTFQQVESLSRRQETLVFVADTLIRDIRNAHTITHESNAIRLTVPGDALSSCSTSDLDKRYYLNPAPSGGYSLTLSECRESVGWKISQPLISGFHDDAAFSVGAKGSGHYQLTLELGANNSQGYETLVFNVQNRTAALTRHATRKTPEGGE